MGPPRACAADFFCRLRSKGWWRLVPVGYGPGARHVFQTPAPIRNPSNFSILSGVAGTDAPVAHQLPIRLSMPSGEDCPHCRGGLSAGAGQVIHRVDQPMRRVPSPSTPPRAEAVRSAPERATHAKPLSSRSCVRARATRVSTVARARMPQPMRPNVPSRSALAPLRPVGRVISIRGCCRCARLRRRRPPARVSACGPDLRRKVDAQPSWRLSLAATRLNRSRIGS